MAWSEDNTTKTVVPRIKEYTGLIIREIVSLSFLLGRLGKPRA